VHIQKLAVITDLVNGQTNISGEGHDKQNLEKEKFFHIPFNEENL
jgi:hypothetical protein